MRIKFEVFVDVNVKDRDGDSIQPTDRDIQLVKNKVTSKVFGTFRDPLADILDEMVAQALPRIGNYDGYEQGAVKFHVEVAK